MRVAVVPTEIAVVVVSIFLENVSSLIKERNHGDWVLERIRGRMTEGSRIN